MKLDLIPVDAGNGIVVMHTWSEWLRLLEGVDLEASRQLGSPSAPTTPNQEDE